jgi:hypothetical protein
VAVPGLVLLGLRGLVPDWASMLLAYAFVLPGWMLFDFGLIRAAGRHPPWRLGMGTCGLALGFLAWYGLVDPGFSARMLATTAALLVFDGTTAAICLLQRGRGMGLTLRILGGVLLVNILSDLWRASGIADVRPLWLFTPLPAHIQYGFVAILSTVIVTPLLVLLTAQKLQEELRDLACRDPLTSACNRRTRDEVVSDHWPRASASGEPLCCLMLDIDLSRNLTTATAIRPETRPWSRSRKRPGPCCGPRTPGAVSAARNSWPSCPAPRPRTPWSWPNGYAIPSPPCRSMPGNAPDG